MAKKDINTTEVEKKTAGNDERLLERITDDAKHDADALLDDAKAKAKLIREEADKQAAAVLLDGEQAAQRIENDILIRARTNAELDARKAFLLARHEVIDKTVSNVIAKLNGMDNEATEKFFYDMLIREAVGGETVCPSKKHAEAIKAATQKVSELFSKQGERPLTLGDTVEYKSGFLLIGDGYKKHCSFEAMLGELSERELSTVASLLFDE